MKQLLFKSTTLALAIALFTACGGDSGDSGILKDIDDINITNPDANATLLATQTKSLESWVHYNDGSFSLATTNVTWESNETNVSANFNSLKGNIALLANFNGVAKISVSSKQFSDDYNLNVDGIEHVSLTPANVDMTTVTSPFTLEAKAVFFSGAEDNITSSVSWSTTNTSVATVSSLGVVTVLTTGEDFNVTATRLGESNVTVVTNP